MKIPLQQIKDSWQDTKEYHKTINDDFIGRINSLEWLKEHRDWIESHIFGFGERSFHWMWKLLIDEMPSTFSFCEIGVFRGQVLSLVKMLASASVRSVERYGITPLNSTGGHWESDYWADIEKLHDTFFIPKDYDLLVGLSTNPKIIEQAKEKAPFDILYIDGSHEYADVVSDLKNYLPMVRRGGYLVIDDCNNNFSMPFGYFTGIEDVTKAKLEWLQHDTEFEFIFSVVHNSIFRKL